jgi:hypothetical protein
MKRRRNLIPGFGGLVVSKSWWINNLICVRRNVAVTFALTNSSDRKGLSVGVLGT